MSPLLGALGVLLIGGAVLAGIFAFRQPPAQQAPRWTPPALKLSRGDITRILLGLAIGLVLYGVTGWIVLLIATPVATYVLPRLLSHKQDKDRIARLEATQTWLRSLAGVIIANTPLEEAIAMTVRQAPRLVAAEVERLSNRIANRVPIDAALQAFADDVSDSTVDVAVAHLKLGAKLRGAGLSEMLLSTADTLHAEIEVRQDIETLRAGPHRAMQIIATLVGAVTVIIALASTTPGSMFAPYQTAIGQIMLAIWLLVFAAAIYHAYTISRDRPMPRLLIEDSGSGTRLDTPNLTNGSERP